MSYANREEFEKYKRKKKEILDGMPDSYTFSREKKTGFRRTRVYKNDEYACLKVTAPDGSLVGMYSTETGVDFAVSETRKYVDITPNILTVPCSPAQRGCLLRCVLNGKL